MSRAPYLLCAACFVALVLAKFDPHTGFTSLIRFGKTWEDRRVPALAQLSVATERDSHGYDGQFYAQLALDPLLRDPATAAALDGAAYRARRVLLPGVAYVLGFAQPGTILQVYALLNVGCWFIFAWLLFRELGPPSPHRFARWFACVFSMGVLESVRQSLTDLPALLLLMLAVRAHDATPAPRTGSTALWLGLGHLAKETNLLASFALLALPRPRTARLVWLGLSALPVALWICYVTVRLPADPQTGVGNFTWPLVAVFQQLIASAEALAAGHSDSRHALVFLAVGGFCVQTVVLWRARDLSNPWWRIGAAYGVLLLLLSSWVWSGYWAVSRVVLPLTITFNLLLPSNRAFWPLWAAGNITLLHGVWRFL